ncbi:hypothetical protein QAD02_002106 [Eretmocerus hayati]|uniref:Uncharacterized protein n=1 Tax=Eretmocerus hayati TaxID=131215 RepID=A0ACC2NIB7_9HYME|nr:hypothetical protein QAD02_002106 [Eretmocerus hayati]
MSQSAEEVSKPGIEKEYRKVFLKVPLNSLKRKLWFDAIGNPQSKKCKSNYCCEDHFDIRNDLENHESWLWTGAPKILEANAVPRFAIFSQENNLLRANIFDGNFDDSVYRYSNVQSIIDCFEIEIEKPSNALHQALIWPNYKRYNTDKYLLAVTGDGLITYVSYGVADRGFKHLEHPLQKKNWTLMRPLSVSKDVKSTKEEVKLTKQVASIRIHVERVISRIRHFEILNIHSRVDNYLVPHSDSMVRIACGLVNLQTPVIKQTEI